MAVKAEVGGIQRELSSVLAGVNGVSRALSSWQGCVGGVGRELLKTPQYTIQFDSADGYIYGATGTSSYDFLEYGYVTWGTMFGEPAIIVKGWRDSPNGASFELRVNFGPDLWGQTIDFTAETTPNNLPSLTPDFVMSAGDIELNAQNNFFGTWSMQVPDFGGGAGTGTLFSFGWGSGQPSVSYQTSIIMSCNGRVIEPYS